MAAGGAAAAVDVIEPAAGAVVVDVGAAVGAGADVDFEVAGCCCWPSFFSVEAPPKENPPAVDVVAAGFAPNNDGPLAGGCESFEAAVEAGAAPKPKPPVDAGGAAGFDCSSFFSGGLPKEKPPAAGVVVAGAGESLFSVVEAGGFDAPKLNPPEELGAGAVAVCADDVVAGVEACAPKEKPPGAPPAGAGGLGAPKRLEGVDADADALAVLSAGLLFELLAKLNGEDEGAAELAGPPVEAAWGAPKRDVGGG